MNERYQPHESEHFWCVADTEVSLNGQPRLIGHYPKKPGSRWSEVACESHCKRLNDRAKELEIYMQRLEAKERNRAIERIAQSAS